MWDDELDQTQTSQNTSYFAKNNWNDGSKSTDYDSGQNYRRTNDRVYTRRRDPESSQGGYQSARNEDSNTDRRSNFNGAGRYDRGGYRSNNSRSQNWRESENETVSDGNRSNRNSEWRDKGERQNTRQYEDQNTRGAGNDSTIKFFINSSKVGPVIGRRGAKINEFCEKSGAKIQVDSSSANEQDEVEVTATGSQVSCLKAKEMIEEFVGHFSNMELRDNNRSYSNYNRSTEPEASRSYSTYNRNPEPEASRSYSSYNRNPEPETSSYTQNDTSESSEEPFDWDYFKQKAEEHEKAKFAGLPPVIKDFYDEDPEVAACSKATVSQIRAERNNITVTKSEGNPAPIPNPVWTFEQAFKNHPEILVELKKQGFAEPSPVQCQAWPILLQGHDMIGIAQTGTGKTIAFLLPALIHIEHQVTPRAQRAGPTCLVLAPTRELAQQIYAEALKYSYRNMKSVCVYGGGSRRDQIKVVTKGVEIVIATPGRLVDLIRANIIQLKGVSYMVLDEADRMLDMGFEPDVKYIMSYIRPDRQTVLTSATWPEGVARLVNKYMKTPMTVNVGCLDLTAVHSVEQQFYFISDYDTKRELVFNFIRNMGPDDKVLIFVDRKAVVDDVASDIQINDIHCASLHGDRCQEDREEALFEFKESHTRILVATDLASRGLDVKDVTHVFNMFMPKNLEDYVHRIGRTGRAGRNGISISIIDRQDWGIAKKLIRILEESGNFVPPELVSMAERYEKKKQEQMLNGPSRGGFRGRRYEYN